MGSLCVAWGADGVRVNSTLDVMVACPTFISATLSAAVLIVSALLWRLTLWRKRCREVLPAQPSNSGVSLAAAAAVPPAASRAPAKDSRSRLHGVSPAKPPSPAAALCKLLSCFCLSPVCLSIDPSMELEESPQAINGAEGKATEAMSLADDSADGPALPPSAHRVTVCDEERTVMRRLLNRLLLVQPKLKGCEDDLFGPLLLGAARALLAYPAHKQEAVFTQVVADLQEAVTWRTAAEASRIEREGIDERLITLECQAQAHHYGHTNGGLPVIVDSGDEWRRSIFAARRLGVSAAQYATTRIYWHETCCRLTERLHAEGRGNGQFIHIIDLGGLSDLSFGQIRELWPYIKESILVVSNMYTGTARRIYLARPPWVFNFGWSLMKPILTEQQRYRIAVLPSRAAQRLDDYWSSGKEMLTAIAADSLPPPLGGTAASPLRAVHCCRLLPTLAPANDTNTRSGS